MVSEDFVGATWAGVGAACISDDEADFDPAVLQDVNPPARLKANTTTRLKKTVLRIHSLRFNPLQAMHTP